MRENALLLLTAIYFAVPQVFSSNVISIPLFKAESRNKLISHNHDRIKRSDRDVFVESLILKGRQIALYGEIEVGSKSEKLKVLFDTGSSILWVPSANCESCEHHAKFHCDGSSSCKKLSKTDDIRYITGYVEGNYTQDTIKVNDITLEDFVFLEADLITNIILVRAEFDGIAGMATPYGDKKSLINVMRNKQLLKENVFGYYINKNSTAGVLTLGGYEDSRIDGPTMYPIKLHPPKTTSWGFQIDEIALGHDSLCSKKLPCSAIADTGTTLIVAPSDSVFTIVRLLSTLAPIGFDASLGLFHIPCSKTSLLPNLTFTIGGHQYTLTPEMYTIDDSTGRCIIGLQRDSWSFNSRWILGSLFLKNYYTIHDCDKMTITFAKLKMDQPPIQAWHNSSRHGNLATSVTPRGTIVSIISIINVLFYLKNIY